MSPPLAVPSLDDDIVVFRVPPGIDQSPDDARRNLQSAIDARGGVRRPLLIDARGARPLQPEVRHVYIGERISAFTAFAMIVDANPVGRMMGNIYLRISRLPIPTQLFSDEAPARAWLRRYCP